MTTRVKSAKNLFLLKGNLAGITFSVLFIIAIFLGSYWITADISFAAPAKQTFKVGLKIVDFEYNSPEGRKEIVTVAVWYPTLKTPRSFTYYQNATKGKIKSKVALNAPITTKAGPYPLILYSHGAFGTGYNGAFFAEYLAAQGYVVVAPDYVDTKPPDYTEQIAFYRIKGGNVGRTLSVLQIAGKFVEEMEQNRDFFLSYLAEHRFNHTSFIIDKIMELNRNSNSGFYQTIREEAIGICGHSEGGVTALGKIGAHPDINFKDDRIKAALLFSAPAYPFEDSLSNIDVPVMLMVGDNDSPALHPELTRRTIYDRTNPPKFYLVLKNATHFTFGNEGCEGKPLYQAVNDIPQVNAIARYGLAFFEKYLSGKLSEAEQLEKFDSSWAYYVKEEKPGESHEWGKEPPAISGGVGGIKEQIKKTPLGGSKSNIRELISKLLKYRR